MSLRIPALNNWHHTYTSLGAHPLVIFRNPSKYSPTEQDFGTVTSLPHDSKLFFEASSLGAAALRRRPLFFLGGSYTGGSGTHSMPGAGFSFLGRPCPRLTGTTSGSVSPFLLWYDESECGPSSTMGVHDTCSRHLGHHWLTKTSCKQRSDKNHNRSAYIGLIRPNSNIKRYREPCEKTGFKPPHLSLNLNLDLRTRGKRETRSDHHHTTRHNHHFHHYTAPARREKRERETAQRGRVRRLGFPASGDFLLSSASV
ncbi:hypothetical protein F2Q68_00013865 [Brassica cretica]|uniref:Uncharacterized protein n=1 Tax=Brassica cretica TaxID=69181 RepID=A0A8S9HEF3_BRACR|nr:hypothetical protein F2Q68_00013865 [Brassica cretica]